MSVCIQCEVIIDHYRCAVDDVPSWAELGVELEEA